MKRYLLLLVFPLLWGCASTGETPAERLRALYQPDRPFPESSFASFGGIRLHYRTWSPPGATAGKILMLHAAGASTASFQALASQLAQEGYAVVAVDLPGFGFSDQALQFAHTLENRAGLLWSLLDRLDTEENAFPPADRWVLGGHGMGGQVVTMMTLSRPNRSEGLILFATEVLGRQRVGPLLWFPPVRWALRSWLSNSLYTVEGVTELLGEAYGKPPSEEEIDRYAAPLMRPGMARAYVVYARSTGAFELEPASVSAPTLVIWGADDAWIDPGLAGPTARAFPNGTLAIIAASGHLPMETHTAAVRDAILTWRRAN